MKKGTLLVSVIAVAGMASAVSAQNKWAKTAGTVIAQDATDHIATGPVIATDGYLTISPDEFGAWASLGFGGGGDLFNPAGAPTAQEAGFTSALFMFAPAGERTLLSGNATHQAVYPGPTLSTVVTVPNVFSDTTGDGVNDTVISSFDVFGTNLVVSFNVRQSVRSAGSVAELRQHYRITNVLPIPATFILVRNYDGDLPWTGGANFFTDDSVGTETNGAGHGPSVFMEEATIPGDTAVTLSCQQANFYYGGKHGVDPLGAGLPFDFGTDTEVWDNFGIPPNWLDFIAGVGPGVNGVSGPTPPGSTFPEDGFVGLDIAVALAPSANTTITIVHTFGQKLPCDPCDMNCDGRVDAFDIEPFLNLLFGPGAPCGPCTGDVNDDGVVNAFDIEPFLECLFG